jgi:hypothetical protein
MPNTVILEYFVPSEKEDALLWFLEQMFHVVKYEESYGGYTFKRWKDPMKASKPPSILGLQSILSKHVPESSKVRIINIDWFNNPNEDMNNMNWLRYKVT